MSELKSVFKPYSLETELEADYGKDCVVIDVSGGKHASTIASLKRVVDQMDGYLRKVDAPALAAKKLYVTGHWMATPLDMQNITEADAVEIKVSVPISARILRS